MKAKILRRVLAVLMTFVMLAGLFAVPVSAEEGEGVVIKLHYNRPDGDYTDWSVWFWDYGKEGKDIPFNEEDGEMVATYPVAAGVTQVGFIVKLPNWAAKDVNEDQFIDIEAYVSGTIHVYVESGVKGYELVVGDDAASGVKLVSIAYKEDQGVVVRATAAIDPNSLSLTDSTGNRIAATVEQGNNNTYILVPKEPLDMLSDYKLIFSGEEYKVNMPNIYSTESFEELYTYEGSDLGAVWSKEATAFRVWAPTAESVKVNLYASGDPKNSDLIEQLEMTADVNGTWVAVKEGNLHGTYYTYLVTIKGEQVEACDPYARTTGVNGARAMVIDLDSTDPEGWAEDKDPHYGAPITDAVLYELHVRDLSVDASSGITNKGKFLGLTETGTVSPDGIPTGLDHIKSLGITHLHLLPSYDFGSVDESSLEDNNFNWGYDPVNYNVPEGSYSTDPYNGEVRVAEFKQMVKCLHDNGISVVMDVVYNHVHSANDFCFNKIVPLYFSRVSDSGTFSSGSGCGNDTASERSMVKKYIIDSVLYWVEEYHIDGFRFDLVGLIDTETVNGIIEAVHKEHPNVIFYGEGWTMNTTLTKEGYTLATQTNSTQTPGFAYFSDTIRDALKGSVFNDTQPGYVSGGGISGNTVADCFRAVSPWSVEPTQTVNYASCHDNMTLYDRLTNSTPAATVEERIKMNNLAAAVYMTSQGVPFIHAGEEMLRSKPLGDGTFDHNSYSSPDSVNSLKWSDLAKEEYADVFAYYQGLIAFRKAHPALRMTTSQEIAEHITSLENMPERVKGFFISSGAGGEANDIIVIFNPTSGSAEVTLPEGRWTVYVDAENAGTKPLSAVSESVEIEPISAMVLINDGAKIPVSIGLGALIGICTAAAAAVATALVIIFKKRKKQS